MKYTHLISVNMFYIYIVYRNSKRSNEVMNLSRGEESHLVYLLLRNSWPLHELAHYKTYK